MERIAKWVSGFGSYSDLDVSITDILGRLVFGIKADKFESALDELSVALGFNASRKDVRPQPHFFTKIHAKATGTLVSLLLEVLQRLRTMWRRCANPNSRRSFFMSSRLRTSKRSFAFGKCASRRHSEADKNRSLREAFTHARCTETSAA